MEVLLHLLKRDPGSGEWIEDGTPIHYQDDLTETAAEKANRYGQRWQAKDRKNHRYKIHRPSSRPPLRRQPRPRPRP
jgi:hypothetical protein